MEYRQPGSEPGDRRDCVCVQVQLPCQNWTTIRQYDVLEGNGFVCLRMYAFPVIPRLEGSQTLFLPHPIMVSWLSRSTNLQLFRHTCVYTHMHTHALLLTLTGLNCFAEPWLRVPAHVAFIPRKTNPVKSVFTLLDGQDLKTKTHEKKSIWKKLRNGNKICQ